MRRRPLLRLLGAPLTVALWPRAGAAQPASGIAVIGRLHPGPAADPSLRAFVDAFQEGMRALGQVEGRNYRIAARFAEGDLTRLPLIAADLVRINVDLIVASGSVSVRAAKDATRSIPIVMAMSGPDPVGTGLVASFARPGGNVTGISGQTDELPIKQLELLREIMPRLRDVLVLFNPGGASTPDQLLAGASNTLRLRLHPAPITSAEDLATAFALADTPGAWAAIALADPAITDRLRAPIAALALKHGVPSAESFRPGPVAGGLLSYGIDLLDMHRRSAVFVDKILKGAHPADLPVERPTKFELVLNLKTARALGIAIPQSVLQRADEVIE